ncbi:MAG: DNA mismatch repair endonuclease MutL, partial [Gammaproteobacteria bacterium]|nr:DNA mismatch repair endonuclease MutL [Gammaproteobacteria bacterium]
MIRDRPTALDRMAGPGGTAPVRIRAMAPALSNQIAAGEVIERPASVVKELLENSLDAGARRIEVEAEAAGAKLIRVRDDGQGIHEDDLVLALSSHATSKIHAPTDLERIRSLGFRGEALASIGSVSRLALVSRTADAETAWEIRCEGGNIADRRPAAGAVGTEVCVRDLFFNVPARRKFLRTERTELRHLEEAVRRVALGRFDVALNFRYNGRAVLHLASADEGDADTGARRLGRICGRGFADAAVFVDADGPDMRLRGWLGAPSAARSNTDLQYFFINGRPVRDATARHAIRQAFDTRVPAGRYPAYVLYLDMEPAEVDVNVHPAKQEVRFRHARLVHDFIRRHLATALDASMIPVDSGGTGFASTGAPTAAPVEYAAESAAPFSSSPGPGRPWAVPGGS